ncbi:Intraflagellar transport protein 46 [Sorochytrium milnesiophthora]
MSDPLSPSASLIQSSHSSLLSGDTPPHMDAASDTDMDYESEQPSSAAHSPILSMASSPDRYVHAMQSPLAAATTSLMSSPLSPGMASASHEDMDTLFQYVSRYQPIQFELETRLHCFIPEFLPSIGDIDACIRIPRPDDQDPDLLGLAIVDEPSARQSDPTLLGLKLRAEMKSVGVASGAGDALALVKAIPHAEITDKVIDGWVSDISDLHENRPAASAVVYQSRMPDTEALMQVWDEDVEKEIDEMLGNLQPDIDLPLDQYIRIVLSLLDIPLYEAKPAQRPISVVQSVHALFTLFQAFQESAHFGGQDGEDPGMAPGLSDGSLATL